MSFRARSGGRIVATISRLNSRRAIAATDDGRGFHVPYDLMRVVKRRDARADGARTRRNSAQVGEVEKFARQKMDRLGLADWRFRFDDAKRRGGLCNFTHRTISLALQFAQLAPAEEIRDTILHEIAHALVGPGHGHGAVWQAKARELGCSARRCHSVNFSPPRYIIACSAGCWTAGAERRRRGVSICRRCKAAVRYEIYTPARWAQLNSDCQASPKRRR